MDRDSKQDEDLEKEMYMEEIVEQSQSQGISAGGKTSSVPIEEPGSQSGSYLPAFVERAQNIENNTTDLSNMQKKEPNSGGYKVGPKITVLSPTMSDSQPQPPSKIHNFGMQDDDENDYSLDFDQVDISTSNLNIKPP